MRGKAIYIKIFGDAVIPILGFFLWDWSLYFIVLFYILDLLVNEALMHLKTRKIKSYAEKISSKEWIKNGTLSTCILLLLLIFIHFAIIFIHPGINLIKEFRVFLAYKDTGIEQGFILVPLVVFMGYTSYQGEFIKSKMFTILEAKTLWREHIFALILLNLLTLICLGISAISVVPEWVFLCLIILSTSGFQVWKFRKLI